MAEAFDPMRVLATILAEHGPLHENDIRISIILSIPYLSPHRDGSLAGVESARDLPAPLARRLAGAREYLQAARRVVYPVTDAPVRQVVTRLPTKAAHPRRLARLAAEYQLEGPVGRLLKALADAT